MGQTATEAGSVPGSRHLKRVEIQSPTLGFKREQLASVRLEVVAFTLLVEASFGALEEPDFTTWQVVVLG